MNPEIKAKWVEALRSGKYKQGKLALHRYDEFCCLGVLCDVVAPEEWRKDGIHESFHIHATAGRLSLSDAMLERVGLDNDAAVTLEQQNDQLGKTFPEIADYVEANL